MTRTCPPCPLGMGRTRNPFLRGKSSPPCAAFFLKNWHMCGVCWEDCDRKNSHLPTPPEAANTIDELLKVAQGE